MNATVTHSPQPPLGKGGNEGVEALIGRLADEFTERLNRGERPSVEEYAGRYPAHAEVIRQVLGALELIRASSASAYAVTSPAAAVTMDAETGTLGDFRLLREVGRGGMGVVYEAEQISLDRRVALKVLPFASTLDSRQLQRFKNEAQAAAHLHHTNIVPVYATGVERGVHYYAMQFIEGQTLAEVIEELRTRKEISRRGAAAQRKEEKKDDAGGEFTGDAARPSDASSAPLRLCESTSSLLAALSTEGSTEGPAFFRAVAQLGIQAAEALEHAHQLGIVHRDIKPGNLLVEADGETGRQGDGARRESAPIAPSPRPPLAPSLRVWITDFGLAQMQTDTRLTLTGDILGTLRYMSPEAALAKRVIVDHRTDIYSLGVTLYELLTLEPAFPGQDRQELLRQIAFEEPKSPRRLRLNIPAELETIVLKAMAKNPDERYATARELAADLERFLKDEPIRARRPTLVQRARKWARRHPAVVWSAAVVLFVALVAVTLLMWQEKRWADKAFADVSDEQVRTQQALNAEGKRRRQARGYLDGMTSFFLKNLLAKQPVLTEEHKEFLNQAVKAYEEFAADTGQDEETRAGVADAYQRMAGIRYRLGQLKEAVSASERSQQLYSALAADFPSVPSYRNSLAISYGSMGGLLKDRGQYQDAASAYDQALTIQQQLAADFPSVSDYQQSLARIYTGQGFLYATVGRRPDAQASFFQALEIQKRLAAGFPAEPSYRRDLAESQNELALLLRNSGQVYEAEAAYRQALAIRKQLTAESANEPSYRKDFSQTYLNLGELLREAGRSSEAEEAYSLALAILRTLAAEFPTVPEYRDLLARTHNNLAALLENIGRREEAEEAYRQTLAVRKQLAADFPFEPVYRRGLAISLNNLGILLKNTGRALEAEEVYRQALAIHKQLAADFPTVPDHQNEVAGAMVNLARLLHARKESQAARQLLDEALPYHQAALKAYPAHPAYRRFFRNNRWRLTETLLDLKDHAAAADAAGQLLQAAVEPSKDAYNVACFLASCAKLAQLDEQLDEAKRQELARNNGDRALAALRLAIDKGYKEVAQLQKDANLDPLRRREDFQKLVAELEAIQKKGNP